jgi:hypothetical protein
MSIIRVKTDNTSLTIDAQSTFLTSDTAAASGTLTVKNIYGFAVNQILVIGEIGNEGSEIIKTHNSTAPTGSTITLASNTVFAHSSSTPITVLAYDQAEFSSAATVTGAKTVLATSNLSADSDETVYNDTTATTGYYFVRFKNSITSAFSAYSDPIPVTGYGLNTARNVIDNALGMINKTVGEVLTDDYGFQQINNCQMEALKELKQWSFMSVFDSVIGETSEGSWKVAMPVNIDEQSTKSIYTLRIGTKDDMVFVDKQKWNELISGLAFSTLTTAIQLSDTSIILTDSSDFTDEGTVKIGANSYAYTANDRDTGTLTIAASTTTNSIGEDVFQGGSQGEPMYYTLINGFFYYYPIMGQTFPERNILLDYYKAVVPITNDADLIVLPDPTVLHYYLAWKYLLKQNNGVEDASSQMMYSLYNSRKENLKNKETIGRTFKLRKHPKDNFLNDERRIRLGNYGSNI